ncbi:cation:proton antiporter [Alkalitalea saponilacus]|uniref:Multicomponent Na+:H+ antiporter subunit G n=1 Tax=Alkalitalea saponilacus TaxID=889453 RepID=A0A1T5HTX5_9BACT|nr:monovalent cation/H(+) antiporter subunit G [Alkalitalea saponilacus]ASB50234.1 cation:proton antiporter [Alkalitalea saponilacus]SKC24119.1 multicomponent Na+:H+ antiporter subunit G [Alkalitalea saponilacus]
MIEIIIGILVLIAATVILVSSVGILRFNNLYARMHVVTKVSSFALLLMLIAVNLLFLNVWVLIQTFIIFHVLIFLSPISAHVVAKISTLLKLYDPQSKTPHEEMEEQE